MSLHFVFTDTLGKSHGTYGAYEATKMTANTFSSVDVRLASVKVESDSLMTSVTTRKVAPAASDTFLTVNLREDHSLAVEVGGHDKRRQLLAYDVLKMLDATLLQVGLQTQNKVIDDAIAILHNGSAYLHIAASQLDKLQGVTPSLDTTDAA